MADGTKEMEKVLEALLQSVRLANTLGTKQYELNDIFTSVKTQAHEVDKIEFPNQMGLQLKDKMNLLVDRATEMIDFLPPFVEQRNLVCSVLINIVNNGKKSVSGEELKGFAEEVQKLIGMAMVFGEHFSVFRTYLGEAQREASRLEAELKELERKEREKATSARRSGYGRSIGLAAGGAGLVALTFFTGGTATLAAAVVKGVTVGVGVGMMVEAAVTGYCTSLDVKKLDSMASEFQKCAESLRPHVALLQDIVNKTDRQLELNSQMIHALKRVLEEAKAEQQQREEKAEMQRQLDEKDAEIARLQKMLQEAGHN